jgi:hypothetical protein|nr:MAG TPA: hypothetical protein [Caudoviricetes sp.]
MTNEERNELINSVLPDTVKGQQRPAENLNPDMPYSTDFPQLINKDPASADVFNLINRQLLSNDKKLGDSKADKTYVDKKVADLVNGAPEQLDTLQELSKALNNDKDYAATVNNALAEKLGKTEKAVSAVTADNAIRANTAGKTDQLAGFVRNDEHTWGNGTGELVANFYLGDGAEIAFRKNNPSAGKTAILIDGVIYQNEGLFQCIDDSNIDEYLDNYLPLSGGFMRGSICKDDSETALILYGGRGEGNGSELALFGVNRGDDVANGIYRGGFRLKANNSMNNCSFLGSADGTLKWGNTDLAGAGIVSQQLSQEMSYIKYANGLLVQFGMMEVQGYAGTKMYQKTLPISFTKIYSLQATLGYPDTDRVSSVQAESDLTYIKLYVHNFINDYNAPVYYCNWLMIGSWK